MASTQLKPDSSKPPIGTITGLALIAILCGFAMSVMPLPPNTGKRPERIDCA